MTRRERLTHRVVILDGPAEITIGPAAVGVLIHCHAGGALVGASDDETAVGPGETLLATGRVAGIWRLRPSPAHAAISSN